MSRVVLANVLNGKLISDKIDEGLGTDTHMLYENSFQLSDNHKIIFREFHYIYLTSLFIYLFNDVKNGLSEW